MNAITIKNLPDELSQALQARAVKNGVSIEAEVEHILRDVLSSDAGPNTAVAEEGLGTALRRLREKYSELEDLDFSRDPTLATGASFE